MPCRPQLFILLTACAVAAPSCAVDDTGAQRAALIAEAPDFYFLPPVVQPPAQFGDFVPALEPVVIAEQLDPVDDSVLATLATYTRGGPPGARVRVHLQGALPDDGDADPAGYFVVRFPSGDFPLVGGDRIRFRVLLDGRQLGAADVAVLDRRRDRVLIDRSQYGFVVAGRVLRVKFRIDRGAIASDRDGDGVDDAHDVCPDTFDPEQLDSVGDGVGDVCRCDAVVCEPSRPGCVAGACAPTTGACAPELCIEDAPATFAGTVVGQSFGPIEGAGLVLTSPTGEHVEATTGADGSFTVEVPFADAELTIAVPGFDTRIEHFGFEPASEAVGYQYVLVPNRAWLTVTVWGDISSPLAGAVVNLAYQDGSASGAVTGADGTARFALQPVDVSVDITVTAVDRPPAHRAFDHLEPGENAIIFGLY